MSASVVVMLFPNEVYKSATDRWNRIIFIHTKVKVRALIEKTFALLK